eukprot:1986672-Amphidinium_carterae.1
MGRVQVQLLEQSLERVVGCFGFHNTVQNKSLQGESLSENASRVSDKLCCEALHDGRMLGKMLCNLPRHPAHAPPRNLQDGLLLACFTSLPSLSPPTLTASIEYQSVNHNLSQEETITSLPESISEYIPAEIAKTPSAAPGLETNISLHAYWVSTRLGLHFASLEIRCCPALR